MQSGLLIAMVMPVKHNYPGTAMQSGLLIAMVMPVKPFAYV